MRRALRVSASLFLMSGFGGVILIGTILLLLPISIEKGQSLSLINAFFVSTSAVCVTGLSPIVISEVFTGFGQLVLAVLIHIGGLGFMSCAIVFFIMLGKRIGLKERVLLKESLGQPSIKGIVGIIKRIVFISIGLEIIGAAAVYPVFLKDYSPYEALKISLFHAVSAYNNAGFDIIDGANSLMPYRESITINIVTMILIIVGGLGFAVLYDLSQKNRFKQYTMHTKIVVTTSAFLILSGLLLFKFAMGGRFMDMLFLSVTARTAGFNTIDTGSLSVAVILVLSALMFIGASPGSTGGGIKTTTFFTMLLTAFSMARGKQLSAFHRKIPRDSVLKAFVIAFYAANVLLVSIFLVSVGNPQLAFRDVLFECVSAFGTVGLSTGITPDLSVLSKLVITVTMFFGRLGPFTIACIWNFGRDSGLDYLEEKITVG